MSEYDPTSDKEMGKPTAQKLREAEDLLDFTVKERKEMFGAGTRGLVESGLCDGQMCINHVSKPHGLRGCACRLAKPGTTHGKHFRDMHAERCSQNGQNEVTEFGCDGFKSDPLKQHIRKKPAYMERVYARSVLPEKKYGRRVI